MVAVAGCQLATAVVSGQLGTSYVSVVRRVEEMARSAELRGPCTVVVDGTGVGCAVVDLLRESDMDCELVAVQITGGGQARPSRGM